jgi:hypothetical protein
LITILKAAKKVSSKLIPLLKLQPIVFGHSRPKRLLNTKAFFTRICNVRYPNFDDSVAEDSLFKIHGTSKYFCLELVGNLNFLPT